LIATMIGGAVGLAKKSRRWLVCFLVFASCALLIVFIGAINTTVVYAGSGGSWPYLAPLIINWISLVVMIIAVSLAAIIRQDIVALKKIRDRHPSYGQYGQEEEKLAPGTDDAL